LMEPLHPSRVIGERTVALRIRPDRQHDVRALRGLGALAVEHDEVLHALERLLSPRRVEPGGENALLLRFLVGLSEEAARDRARGRRGDPDAGRAEPGAEPARRPDLLV